MVDVIAILLVGFFFGTWPFLAYLFIVLRKWFLRNDVLYEMDTPEGTCLDGHAKPDSTGTLNVHREHLQTDPECFVVVPNPGFLMPKNMRLFRYAQGNPAPLPRLTHLLASNPGIKDLEASIRRAHERVVNIGRRQVLKQALAEDLPWALLLIVGIMGAAVGWAISASILR